MPELKIIQVDKSDSVKYFNSPNGVQQRLKELFQEFMKLQNNPQSKTYIGKAHCMSMCDMDQLGDPNREKSNFEKDIEGNNFEILAVKRFQRSDAGKVMNNPDLIRTPEVLFLTTKYLITIIIDQDLVPPGQSYFEY